MRYKLTVAQRLLIRDELVKLGLQQTEEDRPFVWEDIKKQYETYCLPDLWETLKKYL